MFDSITNELHNMYFQWRHLWTPTDCGPKEGSILPWTQIFAQNPWNDTDSKFQYKHISVAEVWSEAGLKHWHMIQLMHISAHAADFIETGDKMWTDVHKDVHLQSFCEVTSIVCKWNATDTGRKNSSVQSTCDDVLLFQCSTIALLRFKNHKFRHTRPANKTINQSKLEQSLQSTVTRHCSFLDSSTLLARSRFLRLCHLASRWGSSCLFWSLLSSRLGFYSSFLRSSNFSCRLGFTPCTWSWRLLDTDPADQLWMTLGNHLLLPLNKFLSIMSAVLACLLHKLLPATHSTLTTITKHTHNNITTFTINVYNSPVSMYGSGFGVQIPQWR